MLLIKEWIFGIIFTFMAVFGFIKSKKDIDKIADTLTSQGFDVTIDSKEEKEQLKNEVKSIIGSGFKDVTSSVFTKKKF